MALHHVKHRNFEKGLAEENLPPSRILSDTEKTDSIESYETHAMEVVIENIPTNLHSSSNADLDDDDEDDGSSSSSEADEDSVLSEPEWRPYWQDRKRHHRPNRPKTLKENWDHLERHFDKRERILNKISSGKSKPFLRQIQERELLVRRQAFDGLLLAVDDCGDNQAVKEELRKSLDDREASALMDHQLQKKPACISQRCHNWFIFEMNSMVPAVFSLLVHSIVHTSVYDGLHSCFGAVKAIFTNSGESPLIDLCFFGTIFFLGVLLIRLTGDLYWWLSDQDYAMVKFDFHNRRRLRFWDARVLSAIRVRQIVRVAMFMVGYNCCYSSISEFHFAMERFFFDQSEEVMANLPSAKFTKDHGMCLAEREESFCTRSCQDEIDRQGKSLFNSVTTISALRLNSIVQHSSYELSRARVRVTQTSGYGLFFIYLVVIIV